MVGTLPYVSTRNEDIDPGITALIALPDDDEISLLGLTVTFALVASVAEEKDGGDLVATPHRDPLSSAHVLTHKPCDSTCGACMVGK